MDSDDLVMHGDELDLAPVEDAFAQLSTTLRDTPGQSEHVRAVVETFLADLAEAPSCNAKEVDAWLFEQTWEEPELSEPLASEADQVPVRMMRCANVLNTTEMDTAGPAYQEFLAAYPEHELADEAAENLISDVGYCGYPAAYPAAPAYGGDGPHAVRMLGMDPDEYGFPDSWQTVDVDDTVLVVCVEGPERGSLQQTCYYEPGADQMLGGAAEVDFYATEFTVRAYELRTGELVEDYSEEIGDPCPATLEYDSHSFIDRVPGSYDSDYSDADVRSIFDRLMD
ncbi:hypothetical protein [Nocardiopsis halotolerans]|uniref:hypothetical protein n=1 Tax=Nocardiopsis halotolerans TaxID=124252 RepID=UPI00126964F0|nr:hypothetical protein [Nocardiopsis halotolerans]